MCMVRSKDKGIKVCHTSGCCGVNAFTFFMFALVMMFVQSNKEKTTVKPFQRLVTISL